MADDTLTMEKVWKTSREIQAWLNTGGLECPDEIAFFEGYVDTLRKNGVPVDRFFCGAMILHPLLNGRSWKWLDGIVTVNQWTNKQFEEFTAKEEEEIRKGR